MSFSSRLIPLTAAALIISLTGCDEPSSPNDQLSARISQSRADSERLIAQMRAATAKYHNINVARAEGYVDDGFGCVSDPVLGGMGWHLIQEDLHADPGIDPLAPELLIYEPQKNGGMKLVAVEYEVYQADWWGAGNSQAPSLLDKPFEPLVFEGIPPVFGLHVWLWQPNPAGILEDFNPSVTCP